MSDEAGPFREVQREYNKRLIAASIFVAVTAICARMLHDDTSHWVVALVTACVSGSIGAVLSLIVIDRFYQMRRQSLIADAPKLYGYAGPEPTASAVEKLKRTRKTPPKDVH